MIWTRSHQADWPAVAIADRHYNRRSPGTTHIVAPGRNFVLKSPGAVWVTLWQLPQFSRHAWPGAWVNTLFRKEIDGVASVYIRDAVAATRAEWPDVPELGLITFIDPNAVHARKVRGRLAIGYCYFQAGFKHVGYTQNGLWAMQLTPADMPAPSPALDDTPLLNYSDDLKGNDMQSEIDRLKAELTEARIEINRLTKALGMLPIDDARAALVHTQHERDTCAKKLNEARAEIQRLNERDK